MSRIVEKKDFEKTDFNKISVTEPLEWTQFAIEKIKNNFGDINRAKTLLISLLHPSELIFATAIRVLFDKKIDNFEYCIKKLSQKKRQLFLKVSNGNDTIIDKIRALRRVYLFYSIPEKFLVKLADIITEVKLSPGEDVTFMYDQQEYIIILVKGKLFYQDKKEKQIVYERNSVIIKGLNVPQKTEKLLSQKYSTVMVVNRFEFFNLLASNNNIVMNLFKTMKF